MCLSNLGRSLPSIQTIEYGELRREVERLRWEAEIRETAMDRLIEDVHGLRRENEKLKSIHGL